MKLEKLQFIVEDGVGIITMNYMKNLNAIDDQMADELMYVVDTCENDPNVKVVVLKGMPKAFSAGGDIGYFYNLIQQGGEVNMDSLISKVGNVTDGLKRMSKLVISSVSGAAAGAGVSLAIFRRLCCMRRQCEVYYGICESWTSSRYRWNVPVC